MCLIHSPSFPRYVIIDTTGILFLCGGAFNGLEQIVARRTLDTSIGECLYPSIIHTSIQCARCIQCILLVYTVSTVSYTSIQCTGTVIIIHKYSVYGYCGTRYGMI
jgi:hypothetical protein